MSRFSMYDDGRQNGQFLVYNNFNKTFFYVSKKIFLLQNSSTANFFANFFKVYFYNDPNCEYFSSNLEKTKQGWIDFLNTSVLSDILECIPDNNNPYDGQLYIRQKNYSELIDLDNGLTAVACDFTCYYDSSDFETDLYPELLDNSEQFQLAKSFLNDNDPSKELDPTYWTDTQLKFFKFVEEYNKNVISLRASKKVNANVSGSISQSVQSDIDLSPIVQQLSNINNKLQTTEQIDNTRKSITDVLNQQSNTIQVDEIGLLRSKKGYY